MEKNLEIINIGMSLIDNELYSDYLHLLQKLLLLRNQKNIDVLGEEKTNEETTDAILISLGCYALTHVEHREAFLSGLLETCAKINLNKTTVVNRVSLLLEWLAKCEDFYSDVELCDVLCRKENKYLIPEKIKSNLLDFFAITLSNLEELSKENGDDRLSWFNELIFPFIQNISFFKINQMEKTLKLVHSNLDNLQIKNTKGEMGESLINDFRNEAVEFINYLKDKLDAQKSRLQSYNVQKKDLSQNRYSLLQENMINAFLHSAFMKNTMLYTVPLQDYDVEYDAIDFTDEAPRVLNWGQFAGLGAGHKYNIAAIDNVISNFAEKRNFDSWLSEFQDLDSSLSYVGILDVKTETDLYLSNFISYGRVQNFVEFPVQPRMSLKTPQRRIPLFVLSMDEKVSGLLLFQLKKNWKNILASRPDLKKNSLFFPELEEVSLNDGNVKVNFKTTPQNECISDKAVYFNRLAHKK